MNNNPVEETIHAASPRRPASSNQPQLSQAQILGATAECLHEHGYDGTTIRRIAGRLGCAVGSIYRYCDDKRTLLSIVTQRRFDPVLQAIDDHRPVVQSVRLYAQIATEAAEQYRLMFWLASFVEPEEGGSRQIPPVVTRIIDGWSRQVGDPRAAQRLWAQLHGGLALSLPIETLVNDLAQTFDFLGDARDAAAVEEERYGAPAHADNGQVAYAAQPAEREDLTLL